MIFHDVFERKGEGREGKEREGKGRKGKEKKNRRRRRRIRMYNRSISQIGESGLTRVGG